MLCYEQTMINSNTALIIQPEWVQRHGKVILQCNNAYHRSYEKNFKRIELGYATSSVYLSIIASSDYGAQIG